MSLYQRLLGMPLVYDHLRPFVVGGVDMSPSYANLQATGDDVVVDVGCGTGDALNYLTQFRELHGFDTDPVAIECARKRAAGRPNVHYNCRTLEAADLAALRPTRIMMNGLLHHLSDEETIGLLRMCVETPTVRRMASQDVVYVPGAHLSNLLAYLDRGRYVRDEDGFVRLVERAGVRVAARSLVRCHPTRGRALYLLMALEPAQR